MKIRNLVAAALAASFLCTCAFAGDVPTEDLAVRAVSEDTATASESIAALREMGPAGLDVLFTKYSPEIDRFARNGEPEENWKACFVRNRNVRALWRAKEHDSNV